ncbi:MAG: Flp pilus assembly protein CpaB [Candidatus Humimicrobiaceae bacterium]
MRLRIILIIVAVIIAAVAVFAVIAYITSIRTTAEKEVEKIQVLVAAQNIPKESFVDSLISSKMVALEAIPRKYIADNVLTSLDQYKGFVTISPISKGEQITSTKFARPEQIGVAFTIPSDMVAISIPVNEVIGVSNLISVGDTVNVIATFKPDQNALSTGSDTATGTSLLTGIKEPITKTLLWNVKVLYIGAHLVKASEEEQALDEKLTKDTTAETASLKIATITLAVSPEDSEKLVFSEEMGTVWLALLPVKGVQENPTDGQTFKNIFE